MKDQLITLVEAVRLARLEIECYRDPRCQASAEWTLKRLGEIIESTDVTRAMSALVPDERLQSPSVVPDNVPSLNLKVPYPWRSH
jgi:hypothetical protein